MTAPRRLARIAGILYLLVAVFTITSGVVTMRLVVPGDAAATAAGLGGSATLFRLGIAGELVGAVFFLSTAMVLYLLLKHVDQRAAAAMVTVVAVSVAIQCLNLVNQHAALMIATGHAYSGALGQAGADRLALLFTDLYQDGYLIAQTFFGLWLLPLGYLVAKSDLFPRALGVLLVVGSLGHLADVFVRLLAPDLGAAISLFVLTPAAIAEIAFMLWLVVKGVRTPTLDASTHHAPVSDAG